MAKSHGTPGAYASGKAMRHLKITLATLLIVFGAYAFALGYFWRGFGAVGAAIGFVLATAIAWGGVWLIERFMDPLSKETLAYLRGARGEQLVGWLLEDLPDTWHIFHGIQLEDRWDLDHIVVGPGGMYCISTKNYRGLIAKSPDGQFLYNGRPTDELQQALRQTMRLRERMCALMGTDNLYINAVLAVPFAWIDLSGSLRNVLVLHKDNLVSQLESAPKRLTNRQIDAYVKVLQTLAGTSRDLRNTAAQAQFRAP